MRHTCAALALFLCVFHSSIAATANEADYRSGIAQIAAKYGAKKAWFRAEQAGAVLASVAVGEAAPNDGIQVASLTKSITAIGIALLIQDGKISLDSTLGELLGKTFEKKGHKVAASLRPITIRRLLTHTAGLKTNYASDPIHGVASNPIFRRMSSSATVFDYIIAADANRSDERSKFVYSNFSYSYLGLVIEAVSGKPYEVFCADRIFKPLDITDASIRGRWHVTAPYAGWRISTASMIKIWTKVFDRQNPSQQNIGSDQHAGNLAHALRSRSGMNAMKLRHLLTWAT